MSKKPYQSEERLRKLYHDMGMSVNDIADELDCGAGTIIRYMDKFGIERRDFFGDTGEAWKDEEVLRELYHERKMGSKKIADALDTSRSNIQYWMEKHSIERRGQYERQKNRPPKMFTTKDGYETFSPEDKNVPHHNLVAIAKGCDPNRVFDSKTHVHHKNGIPWDNREQNIELLSHSEHMLLTQEIRRGERNYEVV